MKRVALVGAFVFFWGGCRRPEKPWKLPPTATGYVIEAHTGPEYDTVIFLRLESGDKHKILRSAWDLSIKPIPAQGVYQVWLNAAMYAFAAPLTKEEWEALENPSQVRNWRCDLPDTAALPHLRAGDTLYFLLDRDRSGVFYPNPSQRYWKISILWKNNILFVSALPLGGDSQRNWELPLLTEACYLSLEQLYPVSVAPPWIADLIVTRYIHPFYDQPEEFRWYPVVGALLGEGVSVAVVPTQEIAYENFTYADVGKLSFSSQKNRVGYDWKRYDFNTGTYTIDLSRYFVLRTSPTTYYKMRFIDFYDNAGRKGCVKIEYQPL
ncbi:MAG: HmuY family protein [Bacteroidia bacterium]|nr:HmuY family protein [Bacteroidia bacterium]MDW8133695.1 HmuY family protein [Bacteroidia bacterium]